MEMAGSRNASSSLAQTVPSDANEEENICASTEPPRKIPPAVSIEDYSVFTVPQKRAIVLSGSLIGWLSPMTGSIYYPALNQVSILVPEFVVKARLTGVRLPATCMCQIVKSTSPSQHTLCVRLLLSASDWLTDAQIIQGLAPMMIAGFSDKAGRRPAYFICFIIYIVANLALALQNNYTALLILRMLQSAGSSGTIALSQGLVGDCIVSADRGRYVAYASAGSILGPTLSPVLGGLLSHYCGWHWSALTRSLHWTTC